MKNEGRRFFVKNQGSLGEVCPIHGTPLEEKDVRYRPLWEDDVGSVMVCPDCKRGKIKSNKKGEKSDE